MNEIHVCFATDDHYAPYCGVTIFSMFQNKNPDDRVHVYILHKSLTAENIEKLKSLAIPGMCQVETVQVCQKQFEHLPLPPTSNCTIETYYRLMIPRIFPDVDKMLYLDCDILIKGSLRELYDMDMHGMPLAMVQDASAEATGRGRYCNGGVMLINCNQWREDNIEHALYEYAEKNKEHVRHHDQDMVNGLLGHEIYQVDEKWNKQIAFENIKDQSELEKIYHDKEMRTLHYYGMTKPWHGVYQNVLVDEYFAYMQQVPWELEDKRKEYCGLDEIKYYNSLWRIRTYFNQGIIFGDEKTLILYETALHKEVEYAARDLGLEDIEGGYLIKSDEWKQEKWDFLIIEYHNLAIVDYILKRHGYSLEKEVGRYILLPELVQGVDPKLLAMEYLEYIQQVEGRAL